MHRKGIVGDDRLSAQKALQTVAAGQQAENLLDFDDEPATNGQPSGLAATEIFSRPAAASIISGTSTNPLDDLVSIFGGPSLNAGQNVLGSSGFGGASPLPPMTIGQVEKPDDDILGLF